MTENLRRDPNVVLISDDGIVVTCFGYPQNHPEPEKRPHDPEFIAQFRRPTFGPNEGRWTVTPFLVRKSIVRDGGPGGVNSTQYHLRCNRCALSVERDQDDVHRWLEAFEAAGEPDAPLYLLSLQNNSDPNRKRRDATSLE